MLDRTGICLRITVGTLAITEKHCKGIRISGTESSGLRILNALTRLVVGHDTSIHALESPVNR